MESTGFQYVKMTDTNAEACSMTQQSLQQKIDAHGGAWRMLYDSPAEPFTFLVQSEYSNWIDEQRAWRNSAVFQDMSHHMQDVTFEGPDVVRLLSDLGINSFKGFRPMQAKQYVACNYDGQCIGDAILTCEEENRISIVGMPMAANWIRFHTETGGYDAWVEHDDPPSANLGDRRRFRFQVQGPNAMRLLEELNGGPLPDIPFFKMGRFKVGPHDVTALNHRMSGAPGYEFWGPSEVGQDVKDLIADAGSRHGLTFVGGRTYSVTAVVSGWIASPLPAIYTSENMSPYREWLPATSLDANLSLGGSLATGNVEDHYFTPYDLGYGFMIRFDHDFVGRTSLEAMSPESRKKKVRLVWNDEDVVDIYASGLSKGERYKHLDMPATSYATAQTDRVTLDGKTVGASFYPVYSEFDRSWISLGAIPVDLAVDGQELTVVWGEPNGGSKKITVEPHVQKDVRVRVDTHPVKRA